MLAVAADDQVPIRLRDAVGRDGRERGFLRLRHLAGLAEDLARGGLVEPHLRVDQPDRLEQGSHADRRELRGQDGLLPRHRHERGRGEVEDLVGPARLQCVHERELVEEVGLDELDPVANNLEVLELFRGRAPDDAEDLVALAEQQLGEQRAVLARDPRDQRAPRSHRA